MKTTQKNQKQKRPKQSKKTTQVHLSVQNRKIKGPYL